VNCKCLFQVLEHDTVLHGDGEVLDIAWTEGPTGKGSHESHDSHMTEKEESHESHMREGKGSHDRGLSDTFVPDRDLTASKVVQNKCHMTVLEIT